MTLDKKKELRKFTAAVMDTGVIDRRWLDKQSATVIYFVQCSDDKPWNKGEIAELRSELSRLKALQSGFGTAVCYSDLDTGYTHITKYKLSDSCPTTDSFMLRNINLAKIEGQNKYNVDEALVDSSVCLKVKETLVEHDRQVLRDKGLAYFAEEESLCLRTLFKPKASKSF
jgi:hypothetical protein